MAAAAVVVGEIPPSAANVQSGVSGGGAMIRIGVREGGGPTTLLTNLKKEGQRPISLWINVFQREFNDYLKSCGVDATHPRSRFGERVVKAVNAGMSNSVLLDMEEITTWAIAQKTERWRGRHARRTGGVGGEQTAAAGTGGAGSSRFADGVDPSLDVHVLNCVGLFMEYFYHDIQNEVTTDVKDYIVSILSSSSAEELLPERREHFLTTVETRGLSVLPIRPSFRASVRDLRNHHLGQIISVSGVVTRSTEVRPELRDACFTCDACQHEIDNVKQRYVFTEPTACATQGCGNRSRWILNMGRSSFSNWQKLRLQQSSSENLPPGTAPRPLDVIARDQAVECCKPGDEVVFTGCLVAVPKVLSLFKGADVREAKERSQKGEFSGLESGVSGLASLGARELPYRTVFVAHHTAFMDSPWKRQSGPSCDGSLRDLTGLSLTNPDSPEARILRRLLMLKTPQNECVNESASPEVREAESEFFALLRHPLLAPLGMTRELHWRFSMIAKYQDGVNVLAKCVAPEIYGADAVKMGILLMMVGGVQKKTHTDAMKLRGDINVCIVGDPGTAKSQFLKWVEDFADRAIYTSGKSSSAAGLTASVHRDTEGGENVIEGGAFMLADQGICCIDEFEKLDMKDMTAIHEAMEQQTISITKWGIHATMNARASVLAACNPATGRFDPSRSFTHNVRLPPSILSRFDLMLVLRDTVDPEVDSAVAEHILKNQWMRSMANGGEPETETAASGEGFGTQVQLRTADELRIYCRCAKAFRPRLDAGARESLVVKYVSLRQNDALPGSSMSERMTVRQLESLIRLSEAVAKLKFKSVVTTEHVQTAYQIFTNGRSRIMAKPIVLGDSEDDADEPEEEDEEEDGKEDGGDGSMRDDGPKERKKKKEVVTIAADEFERMEWMIISRLRELDETKKVFGILPPTQSTEEAARAAERLRASERETERSEVVKWYIDSMRPDILHPEAKAKEIIKMDRVISRMIRTAVLLEDVLPANEDEDAGGGMDEQAKPFYRRLSIHPNLPVDATSLPAGATSGVFSRRTRAAFNKTRQDHATLAPSFFETEAAQEEQLRGTAADVSSRALVPATQASNAGLMDDNQFLALLYQNVDIQK